MSRNVLRPSLSNARKLIGVVEFISDVYFNGYEWLKGQFIPALRRLSGDGCKSDRVRASQGYYLLGDVHYLNCAPRAAIRAYRHSVRLWPEHGAAYREMGNIYQQMGERDRALRLLRKAVRVDSSDWLAQQDLEMCEEVPLKGSLYKRGDKYWECREQFASGRFNAALTILQEKRSLAAHRYRARVYGAFGQAEMALREWCAIAHGKRCFEIQSADWFFLPASVWTVPTFWQLLWQARARIRDWSVIKGHDDLCDMGLAGKRRFLKLFLRFHLARTQRDLQAAKRLHQTYPGWTDAAQLVRNLTTLPGGK